MRKTERMNTIRHTFRETEGITEKTKKGIKGRTIQIGIENAVRGEIERKERDRESESGSGKESWQTNEAVKNRKKSDKHLDKKTKQRETESDNVMESDRQTDTDTHRLPDRQTDTDANTHTLPGVFSAVQSTEGI